MVRTNSDGKTHAHTQTHAQTHTHTPNCYRNNYVLLIASGLDRSKIKRKENMYLFHDVFKTFFFSGLSEPGICSLRGQMTLRKKAFENILRIQKKKSEQKQILITSVILKLFSANLSNLVTTEIQLCN